jgi:hypothetical protein
MKKQCKEFSEDLVPEYDFSQLRIVKRGKGRKTELESRKEEPTVSLEDYLANRPKKIE